MSFILYYITKSTYEREVRRGRAGRGWRGVGGSGSGSGSGGEREGGEGRGEWREGRVKQAA